MARTLSQKLVELWGQQIIVDNRGGAGTVIGTDLTVRSAPDGYTIMLANIAMALNPGLREKLPYDALRDLAPIILIASQPSAIAVNPSVPVKTVQELIALARSQKFSFASSGIGGVGHIAGEMFRIAIGADMVHVPYKGGGPAAVDLMAGQVPVAFISLPTVTPHARNARLRIVAITDSARSAAAPDIPTVSETVRGYAVDNWIGMLAPVAVPKEIIARLNGDVLRLIGQADMKQRLTSQGFDVRGSSPEQFGAVIRSDTEKYTKVIRQAGIKPN
ncbi:MAG: tripartite tricarboxylate transporter substrate binding protein [Burkholderiales bacterium]|nr:tripartite tricarboxylate transporter substrate binding protein [Burkholderiales bacterium]